MYQHQVAIGFNPSRVVVGSSEPLEMNGPEVTTIASVSADLLNEGLDEVCKRLRQEAEDLCPNTSKTVLPPFSAVNHTIPLIDERKIYRFRPSKCPEAFRDTGGEGQYTQWVHCEFIVGSETIHPAHTQGVNSGHIQKVPTHSPSPNPAGK